MSNELFPTLQGLTLNVQRSASWPTAIQETETGNEIRIQVQPRPKWSWSLGFEFLMDDRTAGISDLQKLSGFWLRHRGALETFRFRDPDDYTATDAPIGTGDGAKAQFQLVRSLGGTGTAYRYDEPIQEIETAAVKVDGVEVSAILGAGGVVTLASAPAVGAAVTATFSYWWRVRFASTDLDVQQWLRRIWRTKAVELVQVFA